MWRNIINAELKSRTVCVEHQTKTLSEKAQKHVSKKISAETNERNSCGAWQKTFIVLLAGMIFFVENGDKNMCKKKVIAQALWLICKKTNQFC